MTYYVGLCGAAGAGKDTVAEMIAQYFSSSSKKYSFAGPVYGLAAAILGTTVAELETRATKEVFQQFHITQRSLENAKDFYDASGLDFYMPFPEAWWAFFPNLEKFIQPYTSLWEPENTIVTLSISPRKMLELVGTELGREILDEQVWVDRIVRDATLNKVRVAVISDVRFENEVLFVKDKGGVVLEVSAPSNPFAIISNHPSNKGIDPHYIDGVIINTMDGITKLAKQVQTVAHRLSKEI